MQYKSLAAALVIAFPLVAHAQSNVSIYGIMDAAVSSEDNGVDRHTVINSGNQSSSRIGFRGTEELGGGMKAMFNIEAGVSIDTGNADSALFGRRSVVGLEGDFGSVTVGREYTPIAAVAGATDITGQGLYGSNLSAFNYLTRRESNSVNYKSVSMSGFKLDAVYGAGEKTTGPSNDLKGVALEYANGPVYFGAGYHTLKNAVDGSAKEYAFGTAYTMGDLVFMANYLAADPVGADNKFSQVNLGASKAFEANTFYVNLQQNKIGNGAKGNAFTLGYTYALSKRTNVYTSYASMRNNALATFALNASSTKVAPPAAALGADPSTFTVGIRHKF
jgi:predicted porin